ncbi:Coenzyme F420 hydrogenase/dehydrogenase, beta subunit C-terminal domain [Methanothermobacter sp. K4]|uniref:Coenzyme F420 hydrogenase/dehydrogenase, beta subunit C-terminal domain n=1 Tax=Methanothermobacter sp. K4 TaxID=2913262 RepID=UPI00272E22C5|nr:Coenzyme F420 hydrogenase/dehydrogenase, beta subunit C-terminal domain [Methanothermobacter sp. K4]
MNKLDEFIERATRRLPSEEMEEVACELKSHILDSAEAIAASRKTEVNEEVIAEALERMGSPEKIAEMYPSEKKWKPGKIVESGICARCGTCAVICPNSIISFNGHPELREECLRNGHGMCFEVCPRVSSDGYQISIRENFQEEVYHGRGTVRGQDGGVVTTFLRYLLKNSKIDGAIVVGDEHWKPVSLLVQTAEDLEETSKSKYSISTLDALRTAGELGLERVAVVGLPCQINGLRKLQYFPYLAKHDLELGRKGKPVKLPEIRYLIGLFCTEKFEYGDLRKLLRENGIRMEDVEKFIIRRGKLEVQLADKTETLNLRDIRISEGCRSCRDFDASLADVSVGSAGSPEGYSTIIVRTRRGAEIADAVELMESADKTKIKKMRDLKLKRFQRELERRRKNGEYISFYWTSDYPGVSRRADGTYFIRVRARPSGWYSPSEVKELVRIAEKYGARIKVTNRGSYELHDVSGFDVEDAVAELNSAGLLTGSEGPLVRATLACPGKENCGSGIIDTTAICSAIEERFREMPAPYKFKIAVSGCPNRCMRPQIHDVGVAGVEFPETIEETCNGCGRCFEVCKVEAISVRGETSHTNHDLCVGCGKCIRECPHTARRAREEGYILYIGGKAGRELVEGIKTRVNTVDEILEYIDAVIRVYTRYASKPQRERLASTMKRVGEEKFMGEVRRLIKGRSHNQ